MTYKPQTYSIKDLERISGIKAHTIRIWEQRYNVFTPGRTNTNIRIYNDNDLKRLLNIGILIDSGMKISKIASLPNNQLHQLIHNLDDKLNPVLSKLIEATINFDTELFNHTFNQSVLYAGFDASLERFITPLIQKIGILWQTNSINPAHEHFVSNLLKQKLFHQIESLPPTAADAPKIILFLPETEQHELGLLYAYYILKRRDFNVVYLGQSLPVGDLIKAWNVLKAKCIVTFFVSKITEQEVVQIIEMISESTTQTPILVSGQHAEFLKNGLVANAIYISSPAELNNFNI